MEALKSAFKGRRASNTAYEPIGGESENGEGTTSQASFKPRFSWIDYSIFVLLGIAMLWSW